MATTGSRRERGPFRDRLTGYGDLLIWSERVGLLATDEAASLRTVAERRPGEAQAVLDRARELREMLYRVFTRRTAGVPIASEDLDRLNDELSQSLAKRHIEEHGTDLEYAWPRPRPLQGILWPIVQRDLERATVTTS